MTSKFSYMTLVKFPELGCSWRNDCKIVYNVTEIVRRSCFLRNSKNNRIFEYVLWGKPPIEFDQRHFTEECLHDATETGHINKIRGAVPKVSYIQSHWWNTLEHSLWEKSPVLPRFILLFLAFFLFFVGVGGEGEEGSMMFLQTWHSSSPLLLWQISPLILLLNKLFMIMKVQ